jgi:hypothetical protein
MKSIAVSNTRKSLLFRSKTRGHIEGFISEEDYDETWNTKTKTKERNTT